MTLPKKSEPEKPKESQQMTQSQLEDAALNHKIDIQHLIDPSSAPTPPPSPPAASDSTQSALPQ
jgi:hypothetical protein